MRRNKWQSWTGICSSLFPKKRLPCCPLLSHLCGGSLLSVLTKFTNGLLSHLCGGSLPEDLLRPTQILLSHLCGGSLIDASLEPHDALLSHLCGGSHTHWTVSFQREASKPPMRWFTSRILYALQRSWLLSHLCGGSRVWLPLDP